MEIDINSREKLITALEQAGKSQLRKKKARLREIYDSVLLAKSQNLDEKTIIQLLSAQGLHFSRSGFAVTMHRIKKELEKETSENPTRSYHVGAANPKAIKTIKSGVSVTVNLNQGVSPVVKSSGRRKSILSQDKGMFGDLDPPPADGVVELKQSK